MGPPRAYPDPVCRPISSLHNSSIHHFYHHLSSVLHVLPSSPSSIPLHPSIQSTHSLWELPVSLHLLPSNPPPDQCSHSSASMIPLGDQPSLFPPTTTTQCKYIIQTSA